MAERIANQLADQPPRVLEIGPGHGALTEPLLGRFGRVLALELDEPLVSALQSRFRGQGLEVRHADALGDDIDILLAAEAPWQVASNLPYSVGTAIVRRLLPRHDLFSRMVVMLQREVAHRVVAEPGGRGHGLLALERSAWADARLLFDVHPRAFRPAPKVVSSVLVLNLKPSDHDPAILGEALTIAAGALTRPRKMLTNALAPEVDIALLEAAELNPEARPGTITLDGWVRLAEVVRHEHK